MNLKPPPHGLADRPALAPAQPAHRSICDRCRRPASVCFCAHLPRYTPRTHVVFLQHPRERRVAISTCRMAHLAFDGSELHHGVRFDGQRPVEEACAGEGVAVLFPGAGATDPAALPPGWLRTLVVVDGTWSQARKIIERNPLLARLPRVGLSPSRPGNYRIRREPAEHCVATIEAVVEVLGLLEGDVDRYRGALAAFDHMIDIQIARRAARIGPSRYRRHRERPPRPPWLPAVLREAASGAVALYAEANAGTDPDGHPIPQRVLHLLAARPATGECFEAIVRPDGPLGVSVPLQLELESSRFAAGVPLDEALRGFQVFAGDSLICGWGRFASELVEMSRGSEGQPERPFLDLRVAASRRLRGRSGGIEAAAVALGGPQVKQWTDGRGGRRIAALESVLVALSGER